MTNKCTEVFLYKTLVVSCGEKCYFPGETCRVEFYGLGGQAIILKDVSRKRAFVASHRRRVTLGTWS